MVALVEMPVDLPMIDEARYPDRDTTFSFERFVFVLERYDGARPTIRMSVNAHDLGGVHLADGRILSVEFAPDSLTVKCKDWQETELVFLFSDTLAYEYAATDSSSLSHWTASDRHPYIAVALQRAGERRDGWRCFELWSVDERTPALRIVAQNASVERIVPAEPPEIRS